MASTLMHLAIARSLLPLIGPMDENRLLIGSLLPDATENPAENRSASHCRIFLETPAKTTFDACAFFRRFPDKFPADALYLGYYFHLIEDILFRNMLYYDLGYLSHRGEPRFIEELHQDYWILNNHLVRKYRLTDALFVPEGFDREPLAAIAPFALERFLENCAPQFHVNETAKPRHLSEEAVDAFIARCTEICRTEWDALQEGAPQFCPEAHAWSRHDSSSSCAASKMPSVPLV